MKLFKLGWLGALLVPVAIALTALSFLIEAAFVRIALQLLAIVALCVAAWLGQTVANTCQKTLDEL